MNTDSYSELEIREVLRMKNVAVVGMSNTEGKPANFVPKYLIENGYNVIPAIVIQQSSWEKSHLQSI